MKSSLRRSLLTCGCYNCLRVYDLILERDRHRAVEEVLTAAGLDDNAGVPRLPPSEDTYKAAFYEDRDG
jgi:hypothetical protein